jgi:adenylosuccinate lyase
MTILQEFGAFEEKIEVELNEQLPLLATSKILMECVKAGMGREDAHKIIKKHSTTTSPGKLFAVLSKEANFPLSHEQLTMLIQNQAEFAGLAVEQSRKVINLLESRIKGLISKVELSQLR